MKQTRNRNKRPSVALQGSKGFSLLEVMFALFMVALVIAAVTEVTSSSVRNVTDMKESTFARWVALNQLNSYKITLQQSDSLSAANDSGEAELGNISWRWVREVEASGSSDLLEVSVSVFREDDPSDAEPVSVMKGYIPAL